MIKLKELWAQTLGVNVSEISDDLTYQGIPQWDSVGHMNLVAALEEAFGLSLEMDEIISLNSYARCTEILSKYGAEFE